MVVSVVLAVIRCVHASVLYNQYCSFEGEEKRRMVLKEEEKLLKYFRNYLSEKRMLITTSLTYRLQWCIIMSLFLFYLRFKWPLA